MPWACLRKSATVSRRDWTRMRARLPKPATSRAPATTATIVTVSRRVIAFRSSEAVPDAPHGGERQGVAELLAELANVDVDGALVAVPSRSPHAVEELLTGESQAGVVGQEPEQVELSRGKRHDVTADACLAPSCVDLHPAHEHDVGPVPRRSLDPTEDRLHPGDELPRREGLGHVVVGPELQAEHAVDLSVARREHPHGEIVFGPQAPAHLKPVDGARQAHVEDHQAWVLVPHGVETLLTVVGLDHTKALLAQVELDEVGDVLVVLHHDNRPRGLRAHARYRAHVL